MTDPTGFSFLSYRRSRSTEAAMLIRAQRARGIPTWQDVDDLDNEPTEEALEQVLADPSTADVLVWVTPDVKGSAVMRRIEALGAYRRWGADDGFFVIPVAAGGADYDQVGEILSEYLPLDDFRNWNIEKAEGNPIGSGEAARIATTVLSRRMRVIDAALGPGDPVTVGVWTRRRPPRTTGTALVLDWCEHFDNRAARPGAWEEVLLPALDAVADAIDRFVSERPLVAGGHCSQTAAIALGAAFPAGRGHALAWRQFTPGRGEQLWSLDVAREVALIEVRRLAGDAAADDLAVVVGLRHDIDAAVRASSDHVPAFRGYVHVRPTGGGECDLATPGQALDAVRSTIETIQQAKRDWPGIRRIHLFADAPNGFLVLLGQLLNACGPLEVYDHFDVDAVGHYRPAVSIHSGVVPAAARVDDHAAREPESGIRARVKALFGGGAR